MTLTARRITKMVERVYGKDRKTQVKLGINYI